MLDLYLRWERRELVLIDPATGRRIATFEDERARADAARDARIKEMEARAIAEAEHKAKREARTQAEVHAEAEQEARTQEREARIRELEEENRRLRGG